nr:Chain A, ANTI-PLATELET PROTEIN [Haementeria officinalis]1I8N_B Chain B, ANTI-PLATELET PROTEIN [Haementeria officinalis]1I8N_C Chain C, ANTI-PLATELET PROTEIN [Haementeria officinalis]
QDEDAGGAGDETSEGEDTTGSDETPSTGGGGDGGNEETITAGNEDCWSKRPGWKLPDNLLTKTEFTSVDECRKMCEESAVEPSCYILQINTETNECYRNNEGDVTWSSLQYDQPNVVQWHLHACSK